MLIGQNSRNFRVPITTQNFVAIGRRESENVDPFLKLDKKCKK